jgi:hypothetical protein
MYERKYQVLIGDEVVARDMDLKTATILVRALFEEYYADYTLTVSVKEMEPAEVIENVNR